MFATVKYFGLHVSLMSITSLLLLYLQIKASFGPTCKCKIMLQMSDSHKHTNLLFIGHDTHNCFLKTDDVIAGNYIFVALSGQGESGRALILKFISIQYVLLNIIGILY